jgi:hypothetical protein
MALQTDLRSPSLGHLGTGTSSLTVLHVGFHMRTISNFLPKFAAIIRVQESIGP